ncbi:MAG: CBS domain-containing protein [Sedimentisphaerales bacterium]|nr:CBS domain-containing protein [Sedimentisphaerales bacterium]
MKTASSRDARTETGDHQACGCMQRAAEKLKVEDVMTRHVFTIHPTDTVQTAAELMSENHVSCLPVLDDGRFQGILTQSDVLAGNADLEGAAGSITAAQRVRRDVPTIPPETGVLEAGRIMEAQRTKWLPVLSAGRLAGIVTQTDVIGAITSLVKVVEVGAVMNADVTTVDAATTVREATRIMSDQGISCLVAVHGGKMVGILTEKDILRRVCAAGKDFHQVLVADVMSFPVTTVPPNHCLFTTHRTMDRMHIHRLVVTDGDRLVGIVTQTDILRTLKDTLWT